MAKPRKAKKGINQPSLQTPDPPPKDALSLFAQKLSDSDVGSEDVFTTELISEILAEARENEKRFESLIQPHLGNSVRSPKIFYDWLSKSLWQFPYGPSRNQLIGLIWATAFQIVTEDEKIDFLDGFVSHRSFFEILYSLPNFLERTIIDAGMLAKWLLNIRVRLGSDRGGPGLGVGLEWLAWNDIPKAMEILRIWISQSLDDYKIGLCAVLLGCVRAKSRIAVEPIDLIHADHQDVRCRLIRHHSWITTDISAPLTDGNYQEVVQQMAAGTAEERDEAINFLVETISRPQRSGSSFSFGINWLHNNLPEQPTPNWKHLLILLAKAVDKRCDSLHIRPLRDRIPELMPIDSAAKGTLQELDYYLSKILAQAPVIFEDLLFRIAEKDLGQIAKGLGQHGAFQALTAALAGNSSEKIAAAALGSNSYSIRRLGLSLFRNFGHHSLPSEHLEAWNENHLAVLIFQVRTELQIRPEIPFLSAIAPRVEKSSPELQRLFLEEADWQMRNLPGASMQAVKSAIAEHPNSLLAQALQSTEGYFNNLKKCHQSPINSMGLEGLERAMRLSSRKRSEAIAKASDENDSFISTFPKSYLLYGGMEWQTYLGNQLGEINVMSEFSHSMELPRLPAVDPDGDANRRIHAQVMICELEKKFHDGNETSK